MKLSSLIVAATIVATVEGKHKKNGAKASKNNGTSYVGFGGKASKGAKGGGAGLFDNHWWSPTKDKFDVCAVANPISNQIDILGDQSPGVEHAYAVYGTFASSVKGYNSGGKFWVLLGARMHNASSTSILLLFYSNNSTLTHLSFFVCTRSLIER